MWCVTPLASVGAFHVPYRLRTHRQIEVTLNRRDHRLAMVPALRGGARRLRFGFVWCVSSALPARPCNSGGAFSCPGRMGGMARVYQVSLRTLLELVFVAAVAFAFIYWRNQPSPEPSGRYQFISTQSGEQRGVFLDTKTGKAWRGWLGRRQWQQIATPVDDAAPVPAPPATAANVTPAMPTTAAPSQGEFR